MSFNQTASYNPALAKVVPKDAIVLDLEGAPENGDADVVRTLRDVAFAAGHREHLVLHFLADQIEAQTKPPRIPEPGKWGVVVDKSGYYWTTSGYLWTRLNDSAQAAWGDIEDPTLIRPGL